MSEVTEPGHGHSPAAWAAVIVMLIGFTVGTIAFFLEIVWLVWASVVVIVLGAVLGAVLAKLGWGVRGPRYRPKAHS